MTLKFDGKPKKTIRHFFCTTSDFVHHFNTIGEFKLELESGNTQFGSKMVIFIQCDLEPRHMTLKTIGHLFYASFHCHMWIQTGVKVWKRLKRILTSASLTFDLWSWPFAWTSLLSMVTTVENFMIIWWRDYSENGLTDGRSDGRTEPFMQLLGPS